MTERERAMLQAMKSARNLIDQGYDKLARELLDDAIDNDREEVK